MGDVELAGGSENGIRVIRDAFRTSEGLFRIKYQSRYNLNIRDYVTLKAENNVRK